VVTVGRRRSCRILGAALAMRMVQKRTWTLKPLRLSVRRRRKGRGRRGLRSKEVWQVLV
jgi:hypothetical protein